MIESKNADSFLARFKTERRKHGEDCVRDWLKEILLDMTFDYTCWAFEILGDCADQELLKKLSSEILLFHFDQHGLQLGIDYSIELVGLVLMPRAVELVESLVSAELPEQIRRRHIISDLDSVLTRPLVEVMDVKTFQQKFLDGSLGDFDAIIPLDF